MRPSLTALIFARGGSKGLPGKNIKILAGKPLLAWAIETALAVPEINRVVVSTDNLDIAKVAREFGAEVPFIRPEILASDTASEWDAWRHALRALQEIDGEFPDPFISIPTTAPLRLPEDIEACINAYRKGDADIVLAITKAHRNPWFNMVALNSDGTVEPVNKVDEAFVRRQDAPEVHDITTVVYVADPNFVMEQKGIFAGKVRAVQVPAERSIDIDTSHDFAIAEFLMNQRLRQI